MKNEKKYQVNRHNSYDGITSFDVTRYSEDGYRGTTTGTIYANGSQDSTDWCVFIGTRTECAIYIDSQFEFKIVEERGAGIEYVVQYFVSLEEAKRYLQRWCIPYHLNPSLWVSQSYYEDDDDKNGDGKPFLYRIDSN